jgi:hypothetical protein
LADYRDEPDTFEEQCVQLRKRFTIDDASTLFNKQSEEPVPMDGLSIYFEQAWETVKGNK